MQLTISVWKLFLTYFFRTLHPNLRLKHHLQMRTMEYSILCVCVCVFYRHLPCSASHDTAHQQTRAPVHWKRLITEPDGAQGPKPATSAVQPGGLDLWGGSPHLPVCGRRFSLQALTSGKGERQPSALVSRPRRFQDGSTPSKAPRPKEPPRWTVGNWLMNGLSSLRGPPPNLVRRTLQGLGLLSETVYLRQRHVFVESGQRAEYGQHAVVHLILWDLRPRLWRRAAGDRGRAKRSGGTGRGGSQAWRTRGGRWGEARERFVLWWQWERHTSH